MTSDVDEREARLPKWAREEIRDLRRRVSEAESLAQQARLDTNPDGSNTQIQNYTDRNIGLGDETLIRFVLATFPDGRERIYVDANVRTLHGETHLHVQSSDQLVIHPQSSNYVRVTAHDRFAAHR
jgi:hypothetical protein